MKNTQTTTTPEILKTSIDLLTDYYKSVEKLHYPKGIQQSSLHTDNGLIFIIKKNIRHLNLMRIAEEYRLKQ